ncbi:hypothetical protein BA893_24915 [Vibrio natriegens]|uniref:hypothetical protein n=1 Tax=Vibrio natriegens TaxID=691 RepID=UPI0008040701|nr:hypothetical protein [Vibrio natriegens]ANQ24827.1 hypothetical protein BA893_24915 [Vibrio natriegens]
MSANQLEVQLSADIIQFERGINEAKRSLRVYSGQVGKTEKDQAGLNKQFDLSTKQMASYGRGFLNVAGMATTAFAGVAAGAVAQTRAMAEQAREIERMATVSQTSVEQIQALGYASEQYSISGDKMADILKDVNDKIGDFTENEGGEFADFMENIAPKVGLTIDKLQQLSGPEALIAVKSAMDAANVPMKSQIFYLESIASDASALLPLLENQGQKLHELTGRYDSLNVAMSEMDIKNFKEMDQNLSDVGLKMNRAWANAVLGSKEQIDWFSDVLVDTLNWWGALWDNWDNDPTTTNGIKSRIGTLEQDLSRINKQLAFTETQQKIFKDKKLDLDWRNWNKGKQIDKTVEELHSKRLKLEAEIDELTKSLEGDKNKKGLPPKPPVKLQPSALTPEQQAELEQQQKAGNSRLASLDVQYASEREKLKLSHEQRVEDIENLKLSEQEIEKRGFESLAAIKAEYKEREKEFYDTELEEFERKQDEAIQREIDAFIAKEDTKTRKANEAAKQREATEKRIEQSILAMKFGVASQGLSLIAQTAKEGSLIQKAAFAAQKGMAAAQVWMQGEVAAAAALAPPPIGLGPIAGAGQASVIRTLSAVSAGMIMGQAIAGMAHSGISEIPAEGTWLLNKGERVYTNQSANQLDLMFNAIMAMHRKPSAINDPSLAYQNRMAGISGQSGPANVVVNLIEDASRAGTVEQSNDGDLVTLDIKVAKILQSSSTQTSQVMQTRYRTQQYGS